MAVECPDAEVADTESIGAATMVRNGQLRTNQVREEDSAHKVSLVDRVMAESRLYRQGPEFKALLDFVVRLKNFAPFNALLLQIQKPGLGYAASAEDWYIRFGRYVKRGARPLLILRPFGPVSLVYDVIDTEGADLPVAVDPFTAKGQLPEGLLDRCFKRLPALGISLQLMDEGSFCAGSIYELKRTDVSLDPKRPHLYEIWLNRNHSAEVQFTTLVHELGHLFLGHLGKDTRLETPGRLGLSHAQEELEAESVAYLISNRLGVEPNSAAYLSDFLSGRCPEPPFDLHEILKAAGKIEEVLKIEYDDIPNLPDPAGITGATSAMGAQSPVQVQLPLFEPACYLPQAHYQVGTVRINQFNVKTSPWIASENVRATALPRPGFMHLPSSPDSNDLHGVQSFQPLQPTRNIAPDFQARLVCIVIMVAVFTACAGVFLYA